MMKNRLAASAATLACVLTTLTIAETAQAAAIGDASAPASVRISTIDLDLSSSAGTDKLERRIKTASATVCRKDAEKPLGMRVLSRPCYRTTLSNGLQEMGRVIAMRGDRSAQELAQRATGAPATGSA